MRNNHGKFGVVLGIYLLLGLVRAFGFGPPIFPGIGGFPGLHSLGKGQGDEINRNKIVDPYFRQNFPFWVDGMSKDGRAVYTNPIGKWDIAGKVSNKGRSEEFKDYIVSNLEEVKRAIKNTSEMHPGNPDVKQAICIYDWDGFDWTQILNFQAVHDILEFARIYEKHYAGMLHLLYFINCADTIATLVNLMKPIIVPDTSKRLKVYNKDKQLWQRDILQHIDADQIRPAFGGKKDNNKNPFVNNSNSTTPSNDINPSNHTSPSNGTDTANGTNPSNHTSPSNGTDTANGTHLANGTDIANDTLLADGTDTSNGTSPSDGTSP